MTLRHRLERTYRDLLDKPVLRGALGADLRVARAGVRPADRGEPSRVAVPFQALAISLSLSENADPLGVFGGARAVAPSFSGTRTRSLHLGSSRSPR